MDLKERIFEAIRDKDIEALKELKKELGRDQWLKQFNGSVPPEAWLRPNPFVGFID